MKVIQTDNIYRIDTGDSFKSYNMLPPQIYRLYFAKNIGFYLEPIVFEQNEKMYGDFKHKIDKAFDTFEKMDRNFGILMSGNRGMGKTMFMKKLALEAVNRGLPVILINDNYDVNDFIMSIDQEIMVLFDEFEKIFPLNNKDGATGNQDFCLNLLDGFNHIKKFFVVTCNDIIKINDYFLDRPGRFHYHFKFEQPSYDEIIEYFKDNVNEKYKTEYEKAARILVTGNSNYDILRAIAFELNQNEPINSIFNLLNINADCSKILYAMVEYNDGTCHIKENSYYFNIKDNVITKWISDNHLGNGCKISYKKAKDHEIVNTYITEIQIKVNFIDAEYDYKENIWTYTPDGVTYLDENFDDITGLIVETDKYPVKIFLTQYKSKLISIAKERNLKIC